ncbi:hypothetical protein [Cupriavidus necator]|uniref:hypothetical protein n=1 Tax=Cupriavidus necator TaxID=106590 RepID=UPI0009C2C074|nr:hypothetical protein [Cupriavidus necator]
MNAGAAPPAGRGRSLQRKLAVATARSRGRLLELWQLAGPAYNMFSAAPAPELAYADAGHQFFGQVVTTIDSLVAQGRVSGNHSMTPTELTNRYVRTLEPPERLRSVFLDEVVAHFTATRAGAARTGGAQPRRWRKRCARRSPHGGSTCPAPRNLA